MRTVDVEMKLQVEATRDSDTAGAMVRVLTRCDLSVPCGFTSQGTGTFADTDLFRYPNAWRANDKTSELTMSRYPKANIRTCAYMPSYHLAEAV